MAGLGGDDGAGRLVLLVIALFVVGARRLEHLRYLAHDPLAGDSQAGPDPHDRTVVNWLTQFTQEASSLRAARTAELPRLTIDVDGTLGCRTREHVA